MKLVYEGAKSEFKIVPASCPRRARVELPASNCPRRIAHVVPASNCPRRIARVEFDKKQK